tara:strand:+ start:224 stop:1465 length:1242 start_codon:yes stop_codon:yes gene_type:complete
LNYSKNIKQLKNLFKEKINYNNSKFNYPLLSNGYSENDLIQAAKTLISKNLTMGKKTSEFEKYFAKKIGAKFALMVNSGSSANLLAFFCITNALKKNKVKQGSECIIPAVCWSTTLWPIIQSGLKPVFVDVDINNFCIDFSSLIKKVTKKTKVIILVNVLGNSPEINRIKSFAKKKNIYLIEDNCESLGSKYDNKFLGTIGDFGTFSFYYSHQVTAAEGGMITCKSKHDYNIIKSLRAHGWDRELKNQKVKGFNFINQGFNLRPLDISASIGMNQFKRLDKMMKIRSKNRDMIIKKLKESKKWKGQFNFFNPTKKLKPSWFGLPLMINKSKNFNKKKYLKYLNNKNIETRPIISGNFANQPSVKLHKIKFNKKELANSQKIEENGFFIGLPTELLNYNKINKLVSYLLNIDKF